MIHDVNVNVNVTAFMYHAGLITQLWTAALMRIRMNSTVFRRLQKWSSVDAANFSSDGRAFQHVGPETGKHDTYDTYDRALGKSRLKLFIVSCVFAFIQVFSTSAGMIWVTLNMLSDAEESREPPKKCQGISHCLERGHPEKLKTLNDANN